MKTWETVEDILDYAIESEQEAAEFYGRLAQEVRSASMRRVFEGFREEELGHKKKLTGFRQAGDIQPAAAEVADLKIGDYLVDVEPSGDLDYQQALIIAMKREKAAFRLYTDLAERTPDPRLQDVLLALAQEEARHKLRFEVEYDTHILTDN